MAIKDNIALHLLFWIYLLTGGGVFYWIENDTPFQVTGTNSTLSQLLPCARILQSVNDSGVLLQREESQELVSAFLIACESHTTISTPVPTSNNVKLTFSNAVFLCMTIVTTIGYGNITPKTDGGKVFCIFYGIVGIPLTGIYLLSISDYFSNHFLALYNKIHRKRSDKRGMLFIGTVGYLIPGLLVFIFIPAAIFMHLEGWTYLDGFYYGFVTLTTIGFGDFVPAQFQRKLDMQALYEFAEIFWAILGLAYWTTLFNFITKVLKSERIKKRWHRTATEMKRMAEHLVPNQNEKFIPQKSKAAFDMVLQLAGSFGNISETDRRLSIPGVASAIKPKGSSSGFQSMFMPILRLSTSSSAPTTPATESNPMSFSNESLESGIGESIVTGMNEENLTTDSITSNTDTPISTSRNPLSDDARRSLDGKRLERSSTRPELVYSIPDDLHDFRDLIMRAMLVLHEAKEHCRATNLSTERELA